MSQSYVSILQAQLSTPLTRQAFLTHFHFVTQYELEKVEIKFPIEKRLIALGDNIFLYGDEEESLTFTALPDATHIYYDTSSIEDVLTLPLMLKIDGDIFSVFLEEGWVQFSYPLSSTGIIVDSLYHL